MYVMWNCEVIVSGHLMLALGFLDTNWYLTLFIIRNHRFCVLGNQGHYPKSQSGMVCILYLCAFYELDPFVAERCEVFKPPFLPVEFTFARCQQQLWSSQRVEGGTYVVY